MNPKTVFFESTNWCNANCIFCDHDLQSYTLGYMDLDLIDAVLPYEGCKFAWLQLFGEPLLYPEIVDAVNKIDNMNVKTGIVTNGSYLNSELCDNLMGVGLDRLIISLGGSDKHTYETIWQGCNYEETWGNAHYAIEAGKENGTRVTIRFNITEENKHQKNDMIKEWVHKTRDIHVTTEWKAPKLDRNPLRGWGANCWWRGKITREACIKWDGTLVQCCNDLDATYPIGNVYETPLLELYNGSKMARLRESVFRGVGGLPPRCQVCHILPKGPGGLL